MREEFKEVLWLLAIAVGMFVISCLLILSDARAADRADIERIARKAAIKHGVDPKLVLAIIEVESNFKVNAKGAAGEVGLMQLHPRYHSGVTNDPARNIDAGVRYLAKLRAATRARYGSAWFVTYNTGPNRRGLAPETTEYYRRVQAIRHRLIQKQLATSLPYLVATTTPRQVAPYVARQD